MAVRGYVFRLFVPILLLLSVQGHATVSLPELRCQNCVTGPFEITRSAGPPASDTVDFPSFAGPGYELVIREWNLSGAGAVVTLNGATLLDVRGAGARGAPPAAIPVALLDSNSLDVTLRGAGGRLQIEVRATNAAILPSCGPADIKAFFTAPLTPASDLVSWVPLGNLEGPSHTLPTHHSYPDPLRGPSVTTPYPIMAPGKVRLVAIEYLPEDDDYSLHLRPCDEVRMYLLHVKRLSARLQAVLGDSTQWSPLPALYAAFPIDVALTAIDFAPGDLLGVTGVGEQTGYDVGLVDTRQAVLGFVNLSRYALPDPGLIPEVDPVIVQKVIDNAAPDRSRQFCALDYFEPGLRSQYMALLGSFGGEPRRTIPPLCGEHMQDIAGTAQGNWFRPTGPGEEPSTANDESDDFAFVHDNVDPGKPVLSLSDRGPAVSIPDSGGALSYHVSYPPNLDRSSLINQDPSNVVPGPVYCFDALSGRFGASLPGLFLVQLPDADNIRLFYFPADVTCSGLLSILPPDFELVDPGVISFER